MTTPMPTTTPRVAPFRPLPGPESRHLRYNRILVHCAQNDVSIRDLAKLLGHTSPAQLLRWTAGIVLPSWPNLEVLATALNTTPADLYPEYVAGVRTAIRHRRCTVRGEPNAVPGAAATAPPVILALRPQSRDQQWAVFVGEDLRAWGYRRLGTGPTPLGQDREQAVAHALDGLLRRWTPDMLAVYVPRHEHRTPLLDETIQYITGTAALCGIPCERVAEVRARVLVARTGPTDRRQLGKSLLVRFPFLAHELPLPPLEERLPGQRLSALTDHQKGLIDVLVAGLAAAIETTRPTGQPVVAPAPRESAAAADAPAMTA